MVNPPDTTLRLELPEALLNDLARRVAELIQPPRDDQANERSPWLTFEQAREYLGFSRDTLYKLTAARAIPCRKKQGGQGLRFHRDELDEWMREQYPQLDRLG
jgi:excisionase family DNA binding protein